MALCQAREKALLPTLLPHLTYSHLPIPYFLVFKDSPAAIRLGLDLRGGTTIVLQPQQTEAGKITTESIAQALEILRKRVVGVGVSESEIRAEGSGTSTKIIVSVPGTTERELVELE